VIVVSNRRGSNVCTIAAMGERNRQQLGGVRRRIRSANREDRVKRANKPLSQEHNRMIPSSGTYGKVCV
jgi:hypothetical protein